MRRVFIDMDGVLADMHGRYSELFGEPPDRNNVPSKTFWANVKSRHAFFEDLPLLPDARELWDGVRDYEPTILTGVPYSAPDAAAQKRRWAAKHFPGAPVVTCESKNKCHHGTRGDILVDDWDKYQDKWEDMGGIFVLHTSAKKSVAIVKGLMTLDGFEKLLAIYDD